MTNEENKPAAVILGGGFAHIPLVEKLKERGFYTILVDYYENPPAKIYSDIHIQESTLDKSMVLSVAQKYNASIVINTSLDQPITTACYVSEQLNLPTLYSYKTALEITNKGLMKSKMLAHGIPTTKYFLIKKKDNINELTHRYPIVIKPSDATGSLGVKKVNDINELNDAFEEAIKFSLTEEVIIEEFFDGVEVSIDCFVLNKQVHLVMMRRQYKMPDRSAGGMQSIGSITPVRLTPKLNTKLKDIASKIVEAFDLNNTPLLIQALFNEDDINIIECAARIGGGTHVSNIREATGFDIMDATIDAYFEKLYSVSAKEQSTFQSTNMIYAQDGIFKEVVGLDKLKASGIIQEYFVYKTEGMVIGSELSSKNRVASFIIKSSNLEDIFYKTKSVMEGIDVIDVEGKSIMRRDIYIKNSHEVMGC